ncbi:MAG: hypothetical protein WDA14_14305 [Sphaerochaetaceae bacterium]
MEKIDKKDRQIIRSLVAEYAKASDDTSHARTAQLWKNLNDKKPFDLWCGLTRFLGMR